MEQREKLHELLDKQKKILKDYEHTLNEIDSHDLVNENEALKQEVEKCKEIIDEINSKNSDLTTQNQGLRSALNDQILDEKLSILKVSNEKLNLYFKSVSEEYSNGIMRFEGESKKKIEELKNIAYREMLDLNDEFYKELDKLRDDLKEKINENREKYNSKRENLYNEVKSNIEDMSNEPVDEELIKKRIKQNNFEIKIGLNLVNKFGILLILIGLSYFAKYSYDKWLAQYLQGIFSFIVGALFLVGGEVLYRKGKDVFAKGVIGGGIGILYFATFNAVFMYKILETIPALFVSVLISMVALVFSLRYNSKTIGGLALVGGYLPFFAYAYDIKFNFSENSINLALAYLFILNLVMLIISVYKKWNVINYLSFILNIPTLIYLVFKVTNPYISISFSILTFVMYLAITLTYPLRFKEKMKIADIVLLGLNTFISCLIVYSLFDKFELNDFRGLLAIIFALIYYGLGQFIGGFMDEELETQGLFYLTALTFAVLIVPFQFGVNWLVLGWLIEGTLLTIYGFKRKVDNIEIAGWIVVGLSTAAFYLISINRIDIQYYDVNYFAFIVGIISILFTYLIELSKDAMQKYSTRYNFLTGFKYFTIVNFWFYLLYNAYRLYDIVTENIPYVYSYYDQFYKIVLFMLVTVITATIISNIKLIYDKVVKYFAVILYVLVDLLCLAIDFSLPISQNDITLRYLSIGILILYNIFVFFNVRGVSILLIKDANESLEYYPMIVAIWFLAAINSILIVQFNLGHINLLFTLLFGVLSFAYITFGFMKKYMYIRKFGLGLLFFAIAKFFVYDLSYLEILGKIFAYLGLGITMLAISYVYQNLEKSYKSLEDTQSFN